LTLKQHAITDELSETLTRWIAQNRGHWPCLDLPHL